MRLFPGKALLPVASLFGSIDVRHGRPTAFNAPLAESHAAMSSTRLRLRQ
jgi:hypothetical protein